MEVQDADNKAVVEVTVVVEAAKRGVATKEAEVEAKGGTTIKGTTNKEINKEINKGTTIKAIIKSRATVMKTVITMVKMGTTIGATTQALQMDKVKVREEVIILPKAGKNTIEYFCTLTGIQLWLAMTNHRRSKLSSKGHKIVKNYFY